MKKIINQKRYDTDTAQLIGSKDNGYPYNDFNYTRETLYRKKTGEFFLHCEGGANSIYGVWNGNNGHWGEHLKPISYEQAQHWAEENLGADEYEKIFGKIEETGEMETVSMSLPVSTAEKLRRIISKTGKTYGDIITNLLDGNINND